MAKSAAVKKETKKETKPMAEQSKALELKKPTAVAAPMSLEGMEGIDASDILIPKLLLMQGLSELVAEGKFQMGDIVNSVTQAKLGDKTKSIEFIPIATFKTWVVMHDKQYAATLPQTLENKSWPRKGDVTE